MHKTENSEICHPYNRLNSLEGNIPSSWARLIMSCGYFSLFKAVHNLHPKQILPGLLHRRTVMCPGLQTILEIALLPICVSPQLPLPSCSKIIFCAFVFNPWTKLFMRNGFL